jgi:hypothetical protein
MVELLRSSICCSIVSTVHFMLEKQSMCLRGKPFNTVASIRINSPQCSVKVTNYFSMQSLDALISYECVSLC